MNKLYRMSSVCPGSQKTKEQMDTVARDREQMGDQRGLEVLLQAQEYYAGMWQFRKDRERNKRYCYGDQWGDMICYNGERMTEHEYLIRQGNLPLKNNLIRRLVRNVIGVMRGQETEPTCIARDRDEQKLGETMSTVLQYNMQLNRMNEMYARTMEEFLIGSLIVHKKWYGYREEKMDCWTDFVQPNNFFIDNNMRDFRGFDVSVVGEIHDVDFQELVKTFAQCPADYERLAKTYSAARNRRTFTMAWEQFGYPRSRDLDFLTPEDESRCRVIEVWRKESKPRWRCHDPNNGEIFKVDTEDKAVLIDAENDRRIQMALTAGMPIEEVPLIKAEWYIDSYWYYYYLTPFGEILREGETPYAHGSHPYVFLAYPFIDGEIHSFVADVIDQQKYVNRLITLYDWIMRASAKGVLMVPEDCIPKDQGPEDFAEMWSSVNGVIVYTPSKTGAVPQQVASNSTNIGIQEMLNLQLKFFEDISGVNGALQGKPGYAGMSAALYNQQTQNATTSLLDILDSFGSFVKNAAYKDMKNIQQFYDSKKVLNIAGRAGTMIEYDPEKIRDVEFDMSVVPSQATPAYRAMANDFLMELYRAQAISLEQLLQTGNFPFADQLLQTINSQKEDLENGKTPEGVSPDLMQQAQQGADMNAVNQAYQALSGKN